MAKCEGDLPFEPLPDIEEKGFWRSAVNFFRNPFGGLWKLIKPFIEFIKLIVTLISTAL